MPWTAFCAADPGLYEIANVKKVAVHGFKVVENPVFSETDAEDQTKILQAHEGHEKGFEGLALRSAFQIIFLLIIIILLVIKHLSSRL